MVQWIGLCLSTAGGTGSIPGLGTKIPRVRHGQKIKKKKKTLNTTLKYFSVILIHQVTKSAWL